MPDPLAPSVSTVVLDGRPFEQGLALLAEAGATVVEPAFIEGYMPFDETAFSEGNARQISRMLADAGLEARAVSAHIDLGGPDSLEKLQRRLAFAAALGARILISNATTLGARAAMIPVVEAIAPELAALGLVLALENPGHGGAALLPDGAQGAAVIASLGISRVRMNYDIGNAATYGARAGSAAEDLVAALPVTAHLHLKDIRGEGADWRFCPVGAGDVGYAAAGLLSLVPPDLPLGIEHPIRLWRPGRGDPKRVEEIPDAATVIAAVRASLAFVARARG